MLLRLGIQQCRSFGEVFLIHDIIAVKTPILFSSPNLHDRFLVNTQMLKLTRSSSPEIEYQQKADVVQVARATLTTVPCHSPITDAARHPAKPNIAAHSVPSFPEIANDRSVCTCKHRVIRTLFKSPSDQQNTSELKELVNAESSCCDIAISLISRESKEFSFR